LRPTAAQSPGFLHGILNKGTAISPTQPCLRLIISHPDLKYEFAECQYDAYDNTVTAKTMASPDFLTLEELARQIINAQSQLRRFDSGPANVIRGIDTEKKTFAGGHDRAK
jgi:hypothetical protein